MAGAGWIGRLHIEALRQTGRAEVAILEPDPDTRRHVQSELGPMDAFSTLDDALRQSWSAAVVASPAHTHVELGRRLTSAGVPLLVEKPLALGLEGLPEWIAAVASARVPVMVGFVFRCHPALEAVRHALRSGRVGRPLMLVGRRGAYLPARRPDYASSYYARRDQGGGVLHDILSHVFNAAEWLVGPIDRLMADAAHLRLPNVDVEDSVSIIGRHGPVLASYSVNQHQHAPENTIEVHGTEGSLRADFANNRWEIAATPDAGWSPKALPALSRAQWFARQAKTFLDVAEHRAPPPCSLEDALVTLRSVLAAAEAVAREDAWTPTVRA
jgi:predicted dehydrogenase